MSLQQQIDETYLAAFKAKEEVAIATLRMLKAAVVNKKIEKKMAKDEALSDDDLVALVKSEVKKRQDSVVAYRAGNREDLAQKEQAEIEILSKFLPEQLPEEQVRIIVIEAIKETGSADFGKIMGLVMAKAKGKADGQTVSKLVKEELAK
ncbi:MAG: GatB/YqeY domain-containing protein [Patescibacteria group bacterium]